MSTFCVFLFFFTFIYIYFQKHEFVMSFKLQLTEG